MDKILLNGSWLLRRVGDDFKSVVSSVLPGDNYSALLSYELIPDPYIGDNEKSVQWVGEQSWTWFREFEISGELLQHRSVYLNIDALDTFGEIRINGCVACQSDNMFKRIRVEVRDLLQVETNTIEIIIQPPGREALAESVRQPFPLYVGGMNKIPHMNLIRKVQCHAGWDWGICLPVSGIYGEIYLQGVNEGRIEHVYAEQCHEEGACRIKVICEIIAEVEGVISLCFEFNGEIINKTENLLAGLNKVAADFQVNSPELWYPAGYGSQSLYELKVSTQEQVIQKRLGLRKLEVLSEPDEKGRGLVFRINGIDIFCKGANWIPMDALPWRQTPDRYEKLLGDAVAANMNMLRVWGGGQYESDIFYQLCDEKGILVWQDFMFACAQYPSTPDFLENVRGEIEYQVKRLRHHACIALWCGDNETIALIRLDKNEYRNLLNFERLNKTLRDTVSACDPERTFRPGSPCRGSDYYEEPFRDETQGDMHYWGVWHGSEGFDAFYRVQPRFCSEFGYQSFPAQSTVEWYAPEGSRNVTSPIMEFHQRSGVGNSKIVEMFSRYFRFPDGFANFIYLSQVQQAMAIKTGVEYWRTLRPHCMGTLYWQLNDNWPVASWSSIDYFGNWKQLHYHAKRFYAPVIATIIQTADAAELWVVSDLPRGFSGKLAVAQYDFAGKQLNAFDFDIDLDAGCSRCIQSFALEAFRRDSFLTLELMGKDMYQHENVHFFTEYKRCDLEVPVIELEFTSDHEIVFTTDKPAFFVFAELKGCPAVFSDNSFTLLPGKAKKIFLPEPAQIDLPVLKEKLTVRHLRGSYTE